MCKQRVEMPTMWQLLYCYTNTIIVLYAIGITFI